MDDLAQELILLQLPTPHAYVQRKYQLLCNIFPSEYLAGQTWWVGGDDDPLLEMEYTQYGPELRAMIDAWTQQWRDERT